MADKTKLERDGQLARIRALMAKTTDNGCTEAEAAAAAAAVDRLLATYEIDLDEVMVREQEIVKLVVKIDGHDVKFSGRRVAEFTDCRAWATGGDLVFLGFKVDTEIAEYLIQLFRRSIDREVSDYTMFNSDYDEADRAGKQAMLTGFRMGMAGRLGERLTELKSKRDFRQKTSGRDLVAIKMPLVDQVMKDLGIVLGGGGRGTPIRNMAAYTAGQAAGNKVSINQGVAGRATQGGRLK